MQNLGSVYTYDYDKNSPDGPNTVREIRIPLHGH